jgi:HSP20 family protein
MRLIERNLPGALFSHRDPIFQSGWPQLSDWARNFDRLFNSAFDDDFFGYRGDRLLSGRPATDLYEDGENFYVRMDLPGMEKEAINVEMERGILTVSGSRRGFGDDGKEERSFEVRRSVRLPEAIAEDHVKAAYEDGVLTVTLPKREEARARRVMIEEGK